MTAPADTYVRILAAAISAAEVPGAKTIDPIMALLVLAAALCEESGGHKGGFLKAAEMAYDIGTDATAAALAAQN